MEIVQFLQEKPMKMQFAVVFSVVALAAIFGYVQADAAEKAQPMLSHAVYFSLKDNSPQAKEMLIAACKKFLTGHPGAVSFAVGPLAEEMKRDVNDRDFDVALHLVFKNKAAHDQYSRSERHQKFIEENKDNWEKVRVFDSYVEE
jgi:hypothetical protein